MSKNLFDIFPVFELEASRLIKMSQFISLIEEIQLFNDELNKWKKNQHEIKNIIVTYHLYENLFSRMKVTVILISLSPISANLNKNRKLLYLN